MKYDLSMIMKKAWEIKKENVKNIFSECLKIAWAEAKNPVLKSEIELLKDYNVVLVKEADPAKNDMLFFMLNGNTLVVENTKRVYAGRDFNNVKVVVVIDCNGKRYKVCADGIKKMAFGKKQSNV